MALYLICIGLCAVEVEAAVRHLYLHTDGETLHDRMDGTGRKELAIQRVDVEELVVAVAPGMMEREILRVSMGQSAVERGHLYFHKAVGTLLVSRVDIGMMELETQHVGVPLVNCPYLHKGAGKLHDHMGGTEMRELEILRAGAR
jgi:hypothetical protein